MQQNKILDNYFKQNNFLITKENINLCDIKTFAEIRTNGFGASDASVLLEVNKYKTLTELIKEKAEKISDPTISEKACVRMGSSLEPYILTNTKLILDQIDPKKYDIIKPKNMYGKNHLNINYDGVLLDQENNIISTMEAKTISIYGGKNYDFTKSIININLNGSNKFDLGTETLKELTDKFMLNFYKNKKIFNNTIEKLKYYANECGVPIYYYPQVQQQLMAFDDTVKYGYLTALNTKTWSLHIFVIPRDFEIQKEIEQKAEETWNMITARKNLI